MCLKQLMKHGVAAIACVLAGPAIAQDATHFTKAYTAFINICLESAPSLRNTEKAARRFGVTNFRFKPELVDSTTVGTHYGYSYPVRDQSVGNSTPRTPGQIAVSYTTNSRMIDRMCVITFADGPDGLTADQTKSGFLKSIEAKLADQNPRWRSADLIEVSAGAFDYEFSATTYGDLRYLYLHIWE
ncbi:MAG: hypothetical protein AB8B82_00390 [Roseovarius sp.]